MKSNTRLTYPDGRTVSYTYDALNRVNTVSIDWLSRTATYSYDDAGRLAGLTQFNGTTVTYGYDDANRMTSLVNSAGLTTIAGYDYTLDGNGNRTQIVTAGALPATGRAGSMDYTYTDRGNRLIYTGSTRLTYDQEGQLTNNGGTPYTFDGMHRLTGYGSSAFAYDGAGNRLLANRGSVTRKYVHDASGNLLVEKDANGNILKYFIYGKGLLAWVDAAANAVYCCHFDGNANTVAVTDSNQAVVNQYSYSPFGIVLNRIEAHPQPFTFVGQFGVFDEGDNIYYMRARYYDANVGRFISEDPKGLDGGDTNLYAYASNNPIMNMDPNGQWIVGGVIGFFAGGVGGLTSGMIGHSSLWGSIWGGALGGVTGALTGAAVGGVLPDFIGTPASVAAGTLAGGIVGGATGGAVSSFYDTGHVNDRPCLPEPSQVVLPPSLPRLELRLPPVGHWWKRTGNGIDGCLRRSHGRYGCRNGPGNLAGERLWKVMITHADI